MAIGDSNFQEDFFQRITNVQWGGAFLYTGGNITLNSYMVEVFPGSGVLFDFPWNKFTCATGASKDGKTWKSRKDFSLGGQAAGAGTNGGSIFVAGISANGIYVGGGAFVVARQSQVENPAHVIFSHTVPFMATSPDGVSWSATQLDATHADLDSQVVGAGYNADTQTFYAVVQGLLSPTSGVVKLYSGKSGTGWSGGSSTNFPAGGSVPFPSGVPAGTLFNSNISNSPSNLKYAACNFPGQVMKFSDGGTLELKASGSGGSFQLAVNGRVVSTPHSRVQSATANHGGSVIVAVCLDDDNGGEDDPKPNPFVYMSPNQGMGWFPVLSDATTMGMGSGGTVSFSP